MPGAIGFAGQINVGSKEAKVAMELSQNPKEQLLVASIKDLGVVDLVKFASLIAEREFPEPDSFLHFNDVDLYISTGATVGLTYYPPGASLNGDMTIFGKQAKFKCTVGEVIKLMATIQGFDIGPLSVKGATQSDPIIDLEFSSEKQSFFIDGAVSIWGALAALHLEANIYPSPTFDLWFDVRLSDIFLLKLQAKLTGEINFKDLNMLQNADFQIHGLMEQHVVQHILQQLEQQIDSAQQAIKHGFDEVKAEQDKKEAEFKAGCDAAIAGLEAARKVWHEKRDSIQGTFDSAKADAARTAEELKAKLDEAERAFKAFVAQAQRELDDARNTANAAIQGAQTGLDDAQRDSDNSIRDAQNDLQRTRDDFHRSFGSAQGDLQNARQKVEDAEREVNNLDGEQRRLEQAIHDTPWYDYGGLLAEKAGIGIAQGTAIASLEVVRRILIAAEAIVQGADFVTAEGAIGAAEIKLEGVREVKNAALDTARVGLNEVKEFQGKLVQTAIDALNAAQTTSDELHGSLRSLIADGPPLTATVEGVLLDRTFSIYVEWQAHFDLVMFIRELFTRLWAMLHDMAADLFKVIP